MVIFNLEILLLEAVSNWPLIFHQVTAVQLCDILVHFYESYQWSSLNTPLAEAVMEVRKLVACYIKNRTHKKHDIVKDIAFRFV